MGCYIACIVGKNIGKMIKISSWNEANHQFHIQLYTYLHTNKSNCLTFKNQHYVAL